MSHCGKEEITEEEQEKEEETRREDPALQFQSHPEATEEMQSNVEKRKVKDYMDHQLSCQMCTYTASHSNRLPFRFVLAG